MILRRLLCGPAPSAGIGYSLGLLLLRVSVGSMMLLGHGWGKLTSFAERSSSFPDPLDIGSSLSMALATGAEAFCALAVILGFATRWAVCAAHGHHASGRAYHTRGRPLGEKGIRPAVLFPLCHPVFSRGGPLLAGWAPLGQGYWAGLDSQDSASRSSRCGNTPANTRRCAVTGYIRRTIIQ